MLLNEYGCESDVLLGLFEGTAVECDSLVQLASLDSERVDAALLDLALVILWHPLSLRPLLR